MGSPAGVRLHPDDSYRLFTPEEANGLIASLERIFLRLDPKLARMREMRELIEDFESYYGNGLSDAPQTDRDAYAAALQERLALDGSIQAEIDEILSFGCEVKDLHRGLVDFPARMDGEIVYLCWQRGEAGIGWWHTLGAGFAGRKALPPQTER